LGDDCPYTYINIEYSQNQAIFKKTSFVWWQLKMNIKWWHRVSVIIDYILIIAAGVGMIIIQHSGGFPWYCLGVVVLSLSSIQESKEFLHKLDHKHK
jgi:hypothetical protein